MKAGLGAVVVFAALAAVALSAVARPADREADLDPSVRASLTRDLKFSAAELSDLQSDRTVRHALDSRAPGEFGVAGATRVHAPKTAFLAAVRDIARFKRSRQVLQIGHFSTPPVLEDLAALTIDADDFNPGECRVGDCGIRLPADVIRRVPNEIPLTANDAQQRTEAWLKKVLFDQLHAYIADSPTRFAQFDDGDSPIRPIRESEVLLEHTPSLEALAPGLTEHLKHFPVRAAESEDFFYWSKEKIGPEAFISITQVAIVCHSAVTCVTVTKDVYSSRYIDASLALSIATDVVSAPGAFYLVYANRSHLNALKGGMSGLRRLLVERRARSALEDSLRQVRTRLETER